MNRDRWVTHSPEETTALGSTIGRRLRRGDAVALIGDLGSGKTQFVKGVAAAFHSHPHVSSPTFVLMNRYDGRDPEGRAIFLHHVDLYRLERNEDILDLGLDEVLDDDGITLIEWADRMEPLLPVDRIDINFSFGTREQDRVIELTVRRPEARTGQPSNRGASKPVHRP